MAKYKFSRPIGNKGIKKRIERIPKAEEAYQRYKKEIKSRYSLPRDKFYSIFFALAGTNRGVTRISKVLKAAPKTVRQIDAMFGIRTVEEKKEIFAEELRKSLDLMRAFDGKLLREARQLLRETNLTAKEIADKLGVSESLIYKVSAEFKDRSKEHISAIKKRVSGRRTGKEEQIKQLLSEIEILPDGTPAPKYSSKEIAKMTGVSTTPVVAAVKEMGIDLKAIDKRARYKQQAGKSSPAQNLANSLVSGTFLGTGEIIEKLIEFDKKNGVQVNPKRTELYPNIIYKAKKFSDLQKPLPKNQRERENLAKQEFMSLFNQIRNKDERPTLIKILANKRNYLPALIPAETIAEWIFEIDGFSTPNALIFFGLPTQPQNQEQVKTRQWLEEIRIKKHFAKKTRNENNLF